MMMILAMIIIFNHLLSAIDFATRYSTRYSDFLPQPYSNPTRSQKALLAGPGETGSPSKIRDQKFLKDKTLLCANVWAKTKKSCGQSFMWILHLKCTNFPNIFLTLNQQKYSAFKGNVRLVSSILYICILFAAFCNWFFGIFYCCSNSYPKVKLQRLDTFI